MEGRRKVDMVRVQRAERLYDKEEVLGRDVSSVFPTESKADEDSITEAVKEAVGSVKFITEKEVEDIKSRQVDDGRVAADAGSSKPLAQVLSERKQQKDDEFQAQWKTMKQGKNRPLDADELDFLDSVEAKKRRLDKMVADEDDTQVLAFQLAREKALERQMQGGQTQHQKPPTKKKDQKVKVVSKTSARLLPVKPVKQVVRVAPVKDKPQKDDECPAVGLQGLLAYGSDSGSE